jgi:hypothetical protein
VKNKSKKSQGSGWLLTFGSGTMDGVGALRDIPAGLVRWLIYFAFLLPTALRVSSASIPEAGGKSPFL